MRRYVITAVLVVTAMVVAVPIYFRAGWDRMTTECGLGDTPLDERHLDEVPWSATGERSVSYSWQWPDGFTCTYSNGHTRSSLWF
ncbi:hypothetical protein E8D34_17030 [Nocardioides sp. GY 10113]|uniref:hypothetical protein n=1 Tax=Nocardioides sp. GY 10113 TaxID=2569761 RepID=UPI0010A7F901|nr:hypothetical protein [Nocardioides sp. GY 10113]TIC82188.1 hypothetical protein E8D34_17030 [Nocardioides sp. GY 10113]